MQKKVTTLLLSDKKDNNNPVTCQEAWVFLESKKNSMHSVSPLDTPIFVRDIPSEVFLSKEDGMPGDCAINLDHIQTVSKEKIGSLITTLSPEELKQVRRAILFALDL